MNFESVFPPADWIWTPDGFPCPVETLKDETFPLELKGSKAIVASSVDLFQNIGDQHTANKFHALALLRPKFQFVWSTANPEYARYYYGDPDRPAWIVKAAVEILERFPNSDRSAEISYLKTAIGVAGLSDLVRNRGYFLHNVTGGLRIAGRVTDKLTKNLDTFAGMPVANKFYWFLNTGSVFRFSRRATYTQWEASQEDASQTEVIDLVPVERPALHWVVCDATDFARTKAVFEESLSAGVPVWFTNVNEVPRDFRLQQYPVAWERGANERLRLR